MAKGQNYNYAANQKLCNYVRLKYRNQLSNGALQLYLLGMPYLERKKSAFCQQVTTNYDEIAEAACKDSSGLKKPLMKLQNVVCEIQLGKPIRAGKKATVFRRFTMVELKEERLKSKIIDTSPVHAQELSKILEGRSFIYGDNPTCKPYWNISKTGRVLSNRPNVQGDSKKDRVESLRHGLQRGQVLFDLDIKQAEPSILQQALNYKFPSDPYRMLADISEFDRQDAKQRVNMLAYATSAAKIIQYWPPEAQESFGPYAEALDKYKAELWEYGKPCGKQRRFVDTLGGSRVYADRGQRNHKGKVLNWHIQGTVADIINTASLEVIERERAEGWRLLFPVHDSIYVVGKSQQSEELKQVIVRKANGLELDLSVDVNAYAV